MASELLARLGYAPVVVIAREKEEVSVCVRCADHSCHVEQIKANQSSDDDDDD